MILTRRGFLKTCLALAAAPAVVRAESLMKLWVPPQELIVPAQELASAQFMAMQIEAEHGGRYIASALVNTGSQWVRKAVSGIVDGRPEMSINAKGEVELVGAKDCILMTSWLGEKFDPKTVGYFGGMVLTGDAKYSAQAHDIYAGHRGTLQLDAEGMVLAPYQPTARRVRNLVVEPARTNLLAGTTTFGAEWSGK